MNDYPSRKFQLLWSIDKGYLPPTNRIAETVFRSILSRQRERWQNFHEDPNDCTDVMYLCREFMRKNGFDCGTKTDLEDLLQKNNGHILPVESISKQWNAALPLFESSETLVLIDDATAFYAKESAGALGNFLKK